MTTEATGSEHVTAVKIKDTSATERAVFRRCRRQWLLSIVHRLHSVEGNTNFWLGNLLHSGLETYYVHLMDSGFDVNKPGGGRMTIHVAGAELGLDRYQSEYDLSITQLKTDLGFIWPNARDTYKELGEMGFDMLVGYFEREAEFPLFDKVVDVEHRLNVPIRSHGGRKVGSLSVRTDAVGYRNGLLAVADHKSSSREMGAPQLELDDQLTAEVYAVWRSRGEFPEEAVYNVLMKKRAEPPKRNQDKKGVPQLSRDKSQATTYDMYRAEIERLGIDPLDYADILEHLRNVDTSESRFYKRDAVMRSLEQMASFEANLYEEFRDMRSVAAHPERAYPNPSPFSCPSCSVRLICTTMQDGGDAEAIIRASYVVGDPRR